MKIMNLVRVACVSVVTLLLIGGAVAAWKINAIRIGGPMQVELQQSSDLIADILPPPAYIIEPFLEATILMERRGADAEASAHRLATLKTAYDERQSHWREADIDTALKTALTRNSHQPAQEFWRELDARFLPAARSGNVEAMKQSYGRLTAAYARHRDAIDQVVVLSKRHNESVLAQSGSELGWATAVLVMIGGAILALALTAASMLLSRVVNPLVQVVDATSGLARGEAVMVPHLDRADELGQMAASVEQFRVAALNRAEADAAAGEAQRRVTASLADSLMALQQGDLTRLVRDDFPPEFATLKTNYNEAVGALREMVQLVTESAVDISGTAREIATASDDLARRTEGNAASLEQTSAALVEVNGRTRTTSAASAATVDRADQAIRTVAAGRASADGAVKVMERVSASARNIDTVIDGLDRIAFQTGVLAMNAAVEAGRAGDAGRGFAVVADLVRALATRAEEEAENARAQLSATQTDIEKAVAAVLEVDGALGAIVNDVEEVHVLLGKMSSDNIAQANAVNEITAAVESMDRATQQNAAMVEQTSAATRSLSSEVQSLAARAAQFKFDRRERNLPVAVDRRKGRSRVDTVTAQPAPASGPRAAAKPSLQLVGSASSDRDPGWASF